MDHICLFFNLKMMLCLQRECGDEGCSEEAAGDTDYAVKSDQPDESDNTVHFGHTEEGNADHSEDRRRPQSADLVAAHRPWLRNGGSCLVPSEDQNQD